MSSKPNCKYKVMIPIGYRSLCAGVVFWKESASRGEGWEFIPWCYGAGPSRRLHAKPEDTVKRRFKKFELVAVPLNERIEP